MKSVRIGLVAMLLTTTNFASAKEIATVGSEYIQLLHKVEQADLKIDLSAGPAPIKQQLQDQLGPDAKKLKGLTLAQGTVDSGGGTIVSDVTGTGLLDLYLFNQEAFADRTRAPSLPLTKSYQDLGMDRLTSQNIPIYRKTFEQLDKWEASSPVIVSWVRRSLEHLPLYYVKYDLGFQDRNIFIPAQVSIPKGQLKLGAFYISGFGAFVSKNIFDALSEKNQMALLVHESLRHAQINFAAGFTNEGIQKITALLMETPKASQSVDQIQWMNGPVLEQYFDESAALLWVGYTINNLCAQDSKYCALNYSKDPNQISSRLQALIGELQRDGSSVKQDAYDALIKVQAIEFNRNINEYQEALSSMSRSNHFGWLDANLRNYNQNYESNKSARDVKDFNRKRISAGHFIQNGH